MHDVCRWRWGQHFQTAACRLARILLKADAEVDARNMHNRTPLDVASSVDLKAVLLERYPLPLKCLAASTVVKEKVPFQGSVPAAVENIIRRH